ncbi:MAG: hypothetical protein ACI3W5_13215 [Faecousia sp.]
MGNYQEKHPNIFLKGLFYILGVIGFCLMLNGVFLWLAFWFLSERIAKVRIEEKRKEWESVKEIELKMYKSDSARLSYANSRIEQLEKRLSHQERAAKEESFCIGFHYGYRCGTEFCKSYFEVEPEDATIYEQCYNNDLDWTLEKSLQDFEPDII